MRNYLSDEYSACFGIDRSGIRNGHWAKERLCSAKIKTMKKRTKINSYLGDSRPPSSFWGSLYSNHNELGLRFHDTKKRVEKIELKFPYPKPSLGQFFNGDTTLWKVCVRWEPTSISIVPQWIFHFASSHSKKSIFEKNDQNISNSSFQLAPQKTEP